LETALLKDDERLHTFIFAWDIDCKEKQYIAETTFDVPCCFGHWIRIVDVRATRYNYFCMFFGVEENRVS